MNKFIISIILVVGALISNLLFAATESKSIRLVISVDWEGDYLAPFNISAIEKFRKTFPQVKMVHFLNAAYFVKAGPHLERVQKEMQSGLRTGDQLGLHIHGWKSLVEAAGVTYKSFPSFWNESPNSDADDDGYTDRGHDVFVDTYSVSDLRKIIRFSLNTLAENGFTNLNIFRTGGWYLGKNVREAIAAEGIRKDSSAVPADLLQGEIGQRPLYRQLKTLWSDITILSQPFNIATSYGSIDEYPNNTALADYVTGEDAFGVFKTIIEKSESNTVTLHFGFHHETADRFLSRVAVAIQKLETYAHSTGSSLEFVTLD